MSVAASFLSFATRTKSSSLKPLEVAAGVPTLTPLVTNGVSGSLGIAFLLTVIYTESRRFSNSFPVIEKGRRSTRQR